MLRYWLNHMQMWGLRHIYNLSHMGDCIIYCPFVGVLFKITVGHQASAWTISSVFLFVGEMR